MFTQNAKNTWPNISKLSEKTNPEERFEARRAYQEIASNRDTLVKKLKIAKSKQTKDSIKRKVVTKWINNCLDYKFFDCQTENSKKKLMNSIVLDEEYMEKILEVINATNAPLIPPVINNTGK